MHYQCLINIKIVQSVQPDFHAPSTLRDYVIEIPYVVDYNVESGWEELTQKLKLSIPKRIKVKVTSSQNPTAPAKYLWLGGTADSSNIGGFSSTPLIMRGDRITFNVGYRARCKDGIEYTYMTGKQIVVGGVVTDSIPPLFDGYVTSVQTKYPLTIEAEDMMFVLKQIPTPSKSWGKMSIQDIVRSIIATNGSSALNRYGANPIISDFNATTQTFNVGSLQTHGETLAQFLGRIKHQYKQDSWFRGNELRIGVTHYLPQDLVNHAFKFTKNIISDKLVWKRKDDVILSCVVKSYYLEQATGSTKDGHDKYVTKFKEILVYVNNSGNFAFMEKQKGQEFPPQEQGERYTMLIYADITKNKPQDVNWLFYMGKEYLKRFYYDGLRGSFLTFGIPYVKHGDSVTLVDPNMPERNGTYMVRRVEYNGGVEDGLRQEIFIDFRVDQVNL